MKRIYKMSYTKEFTQGAVAGTRYTVNDPTSYKTEKEALEAGQKLSRQVTALGCKLVSINIVSLGVA